MNTLLSPDRFNKFYRNKEYIGVRKHDKGTFGDWEETTSIKKIRGRPHNKHEYDLIGEYSDTLWNELINLIKIEAEKKNKDVIIDKLNNVVYSVHKMIHRPKINPRVIIPVTKRTGKIGYFAVYDAKTDELLSSFFYKPVTDRAGIKAEAQRIADHFKTRVKVRRL